MKIKKISAASFGRFKDWESPDLDSDLVLVYGSNESGKTTLFDLISTILYGWDPVTDNPYIPWDSSHGECEAILGDVPGAFGASRASGASGDSSQQFNIEENNGRNFRPQSRESACTGTDIRVIRKLMNRPEGWAYEGEKIEQLANRPLSLVNRISREIFNEVYMLSADELRFPDDKVWGRIQDELLGGQYRSILNPTGEVIKSLEEEAAALWRSDRRGKPRERELVEQQRELKSRLKKAEENEERLYSLEKEMEELSKELENLEGERLDIIKQLDRSGRLYPVYMKLQKIDGLMKKCAPLSSLNHLPEDPEKDLQDAEEAKNKLNEEYKILLDKKEEEEQAKQQFTKMDRATLSQRDEINSLVKSYSQAESDKATLYDMGEEVKRYRDRLTYKSRDLLVGGWQEEYGETLDKIDEASFRASIEAYKNTEYKYKEEKLKASALKSKGGGGMPAALMLVSVILLLSGTGGIFLTHDIQLMVLSALLSLGGLGILIAFIASKGSRKAPDLGETMKNLERLKREREELIDNVRSSLCGLSIAGQRLDDPGESLLVDVNVLRELWEKLDDTMKKRSGALKRLSERAKTAETVCARCSIAADTNILSNISNLERRLREAEEHYMGCKAALMRLDEIKNAMEQTEDEINKINFHIEAVQKGIEGLEGEDTGQKLQYFKERKKDMKAALALKDSLEKDYPDLEQIIEKIREIEQIGGNWIFDDEKISETKVRKERIEERQKELRENMGSLKEEFKAKQEGEKPNDIKGQIESIDNEIKSVKVKRDRLILLKDIIAEADRSFREENQPDVLKKAGEYLNLITGGRYTRVLLGEEGRGLEVMGSEAIGTLDVEKRHLSRGTKGQVYLSLRLALCDHLDGEGERFPLFLDEAMVDWDGGRLQNTISLLENISIKRQVFLFTCGEILLSHMDGRAQIVYL